MKTNRKPLTPMGLSLALFTLLTVSGGGCEAPGSAGGGVRQDAEQLNYDPKRAFLTLDRIQPDPGPPNQPDGTVPELSSRSVRRLSRARELFEQQRYTEAVVELEKAFRHDPNHPQVHRELALAHRAAGNNERVRIHMRKAIAVAGDDIVAHYLLGRLALDDGQNEEAIRQLRIALKSSNAGDAVDHAALCHFHLAKALNAEGYLTAAIAEYREFESAADAATSNQNVAPELETLLRINKGSAGVPISVAYEKLDRFSDAVDALAEAINHLQPLQPDTATRERFARLLARVQRFDEALTQARSLMRDGHTPVELLIDIHEQAGHPQQVLDDLSMLYASKTDRMDVLFAYVDALERFERFDDAVRTLSEAIADDPSRSPVRWRLFDARERQNDWLGALNTAAEAIRTDPELYAIARDKMISLATNGDAVLTLLGDGDAIPAAATDHASGYLLGSLAANLGQSDRARRLLTEAVRHDDQFVPARAELGKLLLDRYDWQTVMDLTCADLDQAAEHGALERLCGQAHAGLDDFGRAEAHLNSAIRLNRLDIDAMISLAAVFREAGEVRRALRQYEAVVEADPHHEAAREELFYLFVENNRLSDAAAQLAELRRRSGSPHRIARCTAYMDMAAPPRNRNWARYCETLEKVIEEQGPDSRTLADLARGYRGREQFEKALTLLDQAIDADPRNSEAMELRVGVLQAVFEYEQADKTMRDLLERHPNRPRWLEIRWRILVLDYRFLEAYELARNRLRRDDLSDAHRRDYRLVALLGLQRLKRHEDRISIIQSWRETEPDNPELEHWLIDAFAEADRHDESIALARALHEADPQDRNARTVLWLSLIRAEYHQSAQQLILGALEIDPEDRRLQFRLVDTLNGAERHDDALELLDNLAIGAPRDLNIRVREKKWQILLSARRFDEAIELARTWLHQARAAQGHPDGLADALRELLLRSLITGRRFEEAVAEAFQWLNETQDDKIRAACHGWIAICHQQRGDSARAIDALQKAYDINPLNPAVNNDLGYTLADANLRIVEAERMIRFALRRQPSNGAFIDSLGWALYKTGKFERALRWLRKASQSVGGDDPVVHEHLGDVNWRMGNEEKAVDHWTKCIELTEQDAEANQAEPLTRRLADRVQGKLDARTRGETPIVAPLADEGGGTDKTDKP